MTDNKTLIKDLINIFNNKDTEALQPLLSETIKHTAQGTAFGVDLEGREAFTQYMVNIFSRFDSIDFRPTFVYTDAESGSTVAEWKGKFTTVNGFDYESKGVFIIDVLDGKVDWVRDYFDTEKTKQVMIKDAAASA